MNWISYALGIATGVGMVITPAFALGLHVKKHPEMMVRKITRSMMSHSAPNNVHK
jgi:hypothetical protein